MRLHTSVPGIRILFALLLAICCVGTSIAAPAAHERATRTPVVVFPAFHFTKLLVHVEDQTVTSACPRSGTFQDWFLNDTTSDFSQVCQDKLLTLTYHDDNRIPMSKRFANQPGVRIELLDYGKTSSAPFYEPMYAALEAAGYTRDLNIRVAGYDSRLTPDMDGFLERSVNLIERTYHENGNTPVHLIGHSNGPLYAQYLLTHTSAKWKARFIHGFTPVAGNFPGQGSLYFLLFTGLNVRDFTFPTDPENARSSALMYLSHPSSYMSAADPKIFGRQEVVVENLATGTSYTPRDYQRLFRDAQLPQARAIARYYIGFVAFADKRSFPNVDVFAEKGSGLPTVVGAQLHDLSVGQVVDASTVFFTRDGDINQEDLTNNAVQAWEAMECFHFSLTDNPGIDHFSLPGDSAMLQRLLANLQRPRSQCD